MIMQSLPAVMSVRAFEAGVRDFDGRAVVDLGGQDGCVLGISFVLLWLSGVLVVGGWLSGVLVVGGGLSGILVVSSWLSDVLLDWLADDSFSDDWLRNFVDDWGRDNGLGQDWCGIAVDCWLVRDIGGLGIRNSLVTVIDHAGVVFADARVWGVNGLGDVADSSMVRSHDVLFRRSMFVVSING